MTTMGSGKFSPACKWAASVSREHRPPSHNTPPQFPLPTTRPPPTWPLLAVPDLRIQIAETPPSGAAGVLIAGPNLCLPLPAQPPSRVASPTPHSRDQVDVHLYFD
ncbi:hypothetical protein ZWY2020_052380 [Hordeum vulgare]|nr:hypothetical protein ZWY2020_052380 [Hordeum vulgare]